MAVLAILVVATAFTALLVVRSGWFRERVRERIVREIETATGGRAELGDFSFDWVLVQTRVKRFTRICTYDRAGYAWSDPGPSGPSRSTVGVNTASSFSMSIGVRAATA